MNKLNIGLAGKLIDRELNKRFTKAGMILVSEYRKGLNRAQPYTRDGSRFVGQNPSKPGEFPKKLTGQLQKSISFSIDRKRWILTVGTTLQPYPAFLQKGTRKMRARPWLSLGWESSKRRVTSVFAGGK